MSVPATLMPVDEARQRLLAAARPLGREQTLALADAGGGWLARPVTARVDVPPHDNSAVDGVALRYSDLADATVTLPVTLRVPAGAAPGRLAPGAVARIFTGAALPAGADTVLMQEDCAFNSGTATLPGRAGVQAGQNTRPAGQDARHGDTVLTVGTRLTPMALGLAASVGVPELTVRRLRVVILSSGDELQDSREAPRPGKIYNSNGPLMGGLLRESGFPDVTSVWLPDDRVETEKTLTGLLADPHSRPDLILASGGVSVGEEDHLRASLEHLGKLNFWRLAIKPGKPFTYGELDGIPFFGLPGNPSAVLVCYLTLVLPFLRCCLGAEPALPEPVFLPAAFSVARAGNRQEYLRVRRANRDGQPVLEKHPNQSSGMLSSAVWADGLAVVPVGQIVQAGQPLAYYAFAELLA